MLRFLSALLAIVIIIDSIQAADDNPEIVQEIIDVEEHPNNPIPYREEAFGVVSSGFFIIKSTCV